MLLTHKELLAVGRFPWFTFEVDLKDGSSTYIIPGDGVDDLDHVLALFGRQPGPLTSFDSTILTFDSSILTFDDSTADGARTMTFKIPPPAVRCDIRRDNAPTGTYFKPVDFEDVTEIRRIFVETYGDVDKVSYF